MPREAELSNNEREFILNALRQNVRLDGRSSDEYRGVELTFGDEYGLVDVKMGKTRYGQAVGPLRTQLTGSRVVVRVSCEVTAPYPDRKFEGMFIITSEFSPMASPAFEVGRYKHINSLRYSGNLTESTGKIRPKSSSLVSSKRPSAVALP